MSYTTINLDQLPAPQIIETLDYERILSEMLADLQARDATFTALVESDPAYKVLEVAAYRELLLRAKGNDGAKAVMLAYARGSDLDQLAALWNVQRLVITPADPNANPPVAEVKEDDETFRARIQLSIEGQTNAGTEGSYVFHSLSADSRVKSAAVKSPSPGEVTVTVLSNELGDGTASADLISAVEAHLLDPEIRQLTDNLTVQSASIVSYRIEADVFIKAGPGADAVMETARVAVTAYVQTMHQIGLLVPISGIYRELQQAGVDRVELHDPTGDIAVTDVQAAYCSAIVLTQQASV